MRVSLLWIGLALVAVGVGTAVYTWWILAALPFLVLGVLSCRLGARHLDRSSRLRRIPLVAAIVSALVAVTVSIPLPAAGPGLAPGAGNEGIDQDVQAIASFTWSRRFEPGVWKASPATRYLMAVDLSTRHLLRGKTRAQVLSMLGPPFRTRHDPAIADLGAPWSWLTGATGFQGEMLLDVAFSDKDVVDSWYVGDDSETVWTK